MSYFVRGFFFFALSVTMETGVGGDGSGIPGKANTSKVSQLFSGVLQFYTLRKLLRLCDEGNQLALKHHSHSRIPQHPYREGKEHVDFPYFVHFTDGETEVFKKPLFSSQIASLSHRKKRKRAKRVYLLVACLSVVLLELQDQN